MSDVFFKWYNGETLLFENDAIILNHIAKISFFKGNFRQYKRKFYIKRYMIYNFFHPNNKKKPHPVVDKKSYSYLYSEYVYPKIVIYMSDGSKFTLKCLNTSNSEAYVFFEYTKKEFEKQMQMMLDKNIER